MILNNVCKDISVNNKAISLNDDIKQRLLGSLFWKKN